MIETYVNSRRLALSLARAVLLVAGICRTAAAVDDVLLQTTGGRIVTGIVDDNTFVGTLGQRVFRQQFLANFRSANPGFVSLATGNPSMPAGAAGFPSNHDVSFDLLPMTIGPVSSNLLYWDGSDAGGDGLDLSDVHFVVPPGISWEVFDANFDVFTASGTNQLVPGGLIERTSGDIDPFDGVDTGSIHKHLALGLRDSDNDPGTAPPQGVYMIAWQARSEGFDTSDPFFFVLRTSTASNAVRDLAADWVEGNVDTLIGLAGDYNRNGVVDAADYVVWRETLGSTTALAADGDLDGMVDEDDYGVWRANFGAMAGGAAVESGTMVAAVPEGGAVALIGSALIFVTFGTRVRGRNACFLAF